jgi:fatty-acid desaturase
MIIGLVLETFQFIWLGISEVVLFLYAEKKSCTYKINSLPHYNLCSEFNSGANNREIFRLIVCKYYKRDASET